MSQPTVRLIGRRGQVVHELRRTLAPLGRLTVALRRDGDEGLNLVQSTVTPAEARKTAIYEGHQLNG